MKKIYTTLMALLILSGAGFAQNENASFASGNGGNTVQHQKKQNTSKTGQTFWANYAAGLSELNAGDVTFRLIPFFGDMDVSYPYGDGTKPVQRQAAAQVFDFKEDVWNMMYIPSNEKFPALDSIFSVKKIGVAFRLNWGSNVSHDVVDTVVISVVATDSINYVTTGADVDGQFIGWYNTPQVPIVYGEHGRDVRIDFSKYTADTDKKYEIRHPLRYADSYEGGNTSDSYEFDIEGFDALTKNSKIIVSVTFISSLPHVQNDVITQQLNGFQIWHAADFRPRYLQDGSEELFNEKSTSLCAKDWCFSPSSPVYYNLFGHNRMWSINEVPQYERPDIGLYLEYINKYGSHVKENIAKNISVRPNPATLNFTLTLADAGTAQVELFNLVGQQVFATTTAEQTLSVNVSSFSNGIYMLKVSQNGKIYTSKVVVK